jgi:tetratricopeptide (TPR) repeat protein
MASRTLARLTVRSLILFASLAFLCVPRPLDARNEYYIGEKLVSYQVYRAAILVNETLPLINSNRLEEAKEKLLNALKLAPDLPEAHYNLALVLTRLGKTEEALQRLRALVAMKTELPAAWLLLGNLYLTTGQLEESVKYSQEFVRRFPNDPEIPLVVDEIKILERELEQSKLYVNSADRAKTGEDYFFKATRNGTKKWPAESMPLRVYIHPSQGITGFHPRYDDILRASFDNWAAASRGAVAFRFVEDLAQADIACLWSGDPSQLSNRVEAGEAMVFFQEDGLIKKAAMVILTVPVSAMRPIDDDLIRATALHEIGHVLGILEHSDNPVDIMFLSMSHRNKSGLSERDRKTLIRLYSVK